MQTQVNETIVQRIHKLMALTTERGASEAEAALAAEHVQRLLAEHNLTMSVVEARGGSTGTEGKRVKEGYGKRQVYRWQRDLMQRIAELNFCRVSLKFTHKWNKASVFDGYELIGRQANVITTQVMFEYLTQTIERLARDDVGNDPTQYFTRRAHSFKEGCSDRLSTRLRNKREELVAEQERKAREQEVQARHPGAASGSAIMLLTDVIQQEKDLNNDLAQGWAPGTTAANRAKYEAQVAAREQRQQEERNARKNAILASDPSIDPELAEWMARGYSRETAEEILGRRTSKVKPETVHERRRRESEERRWERREESARRREAKRLDWEAYNRGNEAGRKVNLDQQIDGGRSRKLP
jgi:hypothetical protein